MCVLQDRAWEPRHALRAEDARCPAAHGSRDTHPVTLLLEVPRPSARPLPTSPSSSARARGSSTHQMPTHLAGGSLRTTLLKLLGLFIGMGAQRDPLMSSAALQVTFGGGTRALPPDARLQASHSPHSCPNIWYPTVLRGV